MRSGLRPPALWAVPLLLGWVGLALAGGARSGAITSAKLQRLAVLPVEGRTGVAFAPTGRGEDDGPGWAAMDSGQLKLGRVTARRGSAVTSGPTLELPPGIGHHGTLLFSSDGTQLFARAATFRRQGTAWSAQQVRLDLDKLYGRSAYPGSFEALTAAMSARGDELALYVQYRATRRPGAHDPSPRPGPRILRVRPATGALIQAIDWPDLEVHALLVADRFVAAAGTDIRVWDRETGKALATLAFHQYGVKQLRQSPDRRFLFSVASDRQVARWDATAWSPQPLRSFAAHPELATALAVHPRAPVLVTGGEDKQLKVFGYDGELLASVRGESTIAQVAIDSGGDLLIVAEDLPETRLVFYRLELR